MRPATEFAAALNPAIDVPDALAAWWVRQVVLRLRREVCWAWWQRTGAVQTDATRLPPACDAAQARNALIIMSVMQWDST